MIIRAYGGIPITYAPDVGEVVLARRTPADKMVRAVVLDARRNRAGKLRVKLQWLDSDPDAGAPHNGPRKPIVAGTLGWVVADMAPGMPPLIRQIDGGTKAAG